MRKEIILIQLDNPSGVYYAGQNVSGRVDLELSDELKVTGKYSYPFCFLLPPGCPSSYEAHIGRVRYFLQADMKIPWAFDKHTRRMITVVQMFDLNIIPEAVMIVNPSGLAFSLYVPVEVIIGSIPLVSIAHQYGVTLPTTPSAPPPPYPGTSQGLYAETTVPNPIPQATLYESAMGRVSTREDGDTEHTTVNSDFAPVYTYYNWNKPDPLQTFAVQMHET